MAALEPLLGDAPSASLLTFAAKCKEVLNNGYSEGKKFPKSQAHEAECVAACCTGGPTVLRELKLAFCHLTLSKQLPKTLKTNEACVCVDS